MKGLKKHIGLLGDQGYATVRKNTEAATESAREYQNGHRIGSRIPNRPSIKFYFSI